jgi:hypothetical protein
MSESTSLSCEHDDVERADGGLVEHVGAVVGGVALARVARGVRRQAAVVAARAVRRRGVVGVLAALLLRGVEPVGRDRGGE